MQGILGFLAIVWFGWLAYRIVAKVFWAGATAFGWAKDLGQDTIRLLEEADPTGEQTGRLRMAVCFIRLGLFVAAADGDVSQEEIESIRSFFVRHGADEHFLSFVDRIIVEAARGSNFSETMRVVGEVVTDETEKLYLCASLLDVAAADGRIDKEELVVVFAIMEGMGFDADQRAEFLQSMLPSDDESDERSEALETLGLDEGATAEEIKKAYRRNAVKYHPDKVEHLGPEFTDVARRKFERVRKAYDLLQIMD